MTPKDVYCNSEIGRLRKVIVHKPDEGISRISPKRSEELLFDDIVHLPHMQREHNIFCNVLKAFVGEHNLYGTKYLIEDALTAHSELKSELIAKVLDYEELPPSYQSMFESMEHHTLAQLLITGYLREDDHIFFDPIPNFIFTRDIAVVIKDHVIITKALKEARHRENLLTRFIFLAHPMFEHLNKSDRIINLNRIEEFPPSKKGEIVSLEGGDMMMIEKDYVMIGCSERTTGHAIQSVKKRLFDMGLVKNIVRVNIPVDRSFMHIDTLFTRIDSDKVVCYKPIISDGLGSNVLVFRSDGNTAEYNSVQSFFIEEINKDMKFIFAGNGETPYQEREQWTDGCNMVALKPGVAITYDRNLKTEVAMKNSGFNVMKAEELIYQNSIDQSFAPNLENTIITLPSAELSRARGGSHCMTCPILRDKI